MRRSIIAVSGTIFGLVVAALAALLLLLRDTAKNASTDIVAAKPVGVIAPLHSTPSKPVAPTIAPEAAPMPATPATSVAAPAPAATPASPTTPIPVTTPQTGDPDAASSAPDQIFAFPDVTPHHARSTASSPPPAPPSVKPPTTAPITAPPPSPAHTTAKPTATATATATIIAPPPSPAHRTAKSNLAKPRASTMRAAPRRPRHRESAPPLPPVETVTIDGVTYVKGREPRSLGTVIGPPLSAGEGQAGGAPNPGAAAMPGPASAPPLPLGPAPFAQH